MTFRDLDALEKLARAVSDARKAYSASEDGSIAESQAFMAIDQASERLDAEGDPADLMLALIAELKAGREAVEELLYAHTDKSIAMGEAFLVRNGKGEG